MNVFFEKQTEVAASPGTKYSTYYEFKEAALLLSLCSALVANDGAVRLIQGGRASVLSPPGRFLGGFLGGLCELISGLVGLLLGLSAGVFGTFSRPLALAYLCAQGVLAVFVLASAVVGPSVAQIGGAQPAGGLSGAALRAVGVLGAVYSGAFAVALLGGQSVFVARLVAFSTDRDFLQHRSGLRRRAVLWNAIFFVAGASVAGQAGVVLAVRGPAAMEGALAVVPARLPVYLFVTGLLMTTWAGIGIGMSVTGKLGLLDMYVVVSFLVFVAVYVHFTVGQLGFQPGETESAARAVMALGSGAPVMILCFMGPYFMSKQEEEEEMISWEEEEVWGADTSKSDLDS